jgi:UDP-hydrolysing UDP-N-acetyl-D-glucosamine 2-epimerase
LENSLNVKFNKYNYILAYHPETLSGLSVKEQFRIILDVVENEEDSFFIFTKSNADTDGRVINQMMEDFASKNPNKAAFFSSLGSLRFLSLMEKVNAIIGNSSAGIIEAKSVNTPAINIGDRQKGRVQPKSVVNCSCNFQEISKALLKINEVSLIEEINNMENPYGDGFTSQKIIDILKSVDLSKLNTKPFFDL